MTKHKFVIFSAVLFLLVACTPGVVSVPGNNNVTQRQIAVDGEGQVFVAPDIAYINIGIHSEADTVSAAIQQNNTQAQAIKTTLTDNGVAENDIQTSTFNLSMQTETNPQGGITRTFFSVDNSVFVTVRNLDGIGDLLNAVVTSGANNINGITFDKQDKSAAQSDARSLAVKSAKDQAEELASLAGVKLGEILSISTSSSTPLQPTGSKTVLAAPAASTVPVTRGQIQVNRTVTIVYALQ